MRTDPHEFFRWEGGQIATVTGGFVGIVVPLRFSADASVAAAGTIGPELLHLDVYGYPFIWEGGTMTTLTDFLYDPFQSDLYFSMVVAISADGETVVIDESRWSQGNDTHFIRCRGSCSSSVPGEQEYVTHPLGHDVSPTHASDDVSVVVGVSGDSVGNPVSGAFVYDDVNGYRYLADVIEHEYGIDLDGWILTEATAVSGDGNVIVGNGENPDGDFEAWLFAFDGSVLGLPQPELPALAPAARALLVAFLGAGALVTGRRRA